MYMKIRQKNCGTSIFNRVPVPAGNGTGKPRKKAFMEDTNDQIQVWFSIWVFIGVRKFY